MLRLVVLILAATAVLAAQTSQATLTGEVRGEKGQPVADAHIAATHEDTGRVITAITNSSGEYTLSFLPQGRYLLRVQARGFRPLVRADITLHVAQREQADFRLEPLPAGVDPGAFAPGAAETGAGLIYGPDAQRQLGVVDARPPILTDATSSTVSGVIDDSRIRELPLNGRDIYTLFVVMPGITTDNATQRGQGFSVNGFPLSSSNYLLDGLDNNNVQTTLPATLLSPDAIQEYRLATNNFSAEYGRGAFVANVVTSGGGNRWHGQFFEYLINEKLSANSFQDNAAGQQRLPFKEHNFGFAAGGPLKPQRLFLFTSLEAFRFSTTAEPLQITLPSPSFIANVSGPIARGLFQRFPELPLAEQTQPDANHIRGKLASPTPASNIGASARIDWDARPNRDSVFVRYAGYDQSNVTYASPYQGLEEPFVVSTRSVGVGLVHRFDSARVNEAKFGWSHNRNEILQQVPGIAQLSSGDAALPGTPNSTDFSGVDDLLHGVENFSWLLARHHIVLGGDYQNVRRQSLQGILRIGSFGFNSLADFGADKPAILFATVNRFNTSTPQAPDYTRASRHSEFGLFLQDNWRVTPRLTLNLGLRYESFGTPAADLNFLPGAGASERARIAAGTLTSTPAAFARDGNNFAPRFGAAFDLFGNSRTILRAGFGIYYDRVFGQIFDALRQNAFTSVLYFSGFKYLSPAGLALPSQAPPVQAPQAYYVDPNLRTPHVLTWFAGVQHLLGSNTVIEVNQTGSLGRKLLAGDWWNRATAPSIYATTNQGKSDSMSLQSSVLRRFSRGLQFQAVWTWSHTIDNQSDPLVNNPLSFVHAYTPEFDSNGDRGNADFDQRHNLIFNWIWRTPGRESWLRGWQVGGLAGYRSGFPLTVVSSANGSTPSGERLQLPRADFLGTSLGPARPADGGMILLNKSSFAPAPSGLGDTTRGEFAGPGFWNYDASISREFRLAWLGESGRLQFRSQFFNLFNHANLGSPDTRLDSPSFGVAKFGRAGTSSLAAGTAPLGDAPRRIELVLRLSF